ncbi:MAG: hypothetical protein JNM10_13130 [Planctomycetia bacterium]|nr:hypothetical protein [Planctomycetia bacterium]
MHGADPLDPTPEFDARILRGRELADRGEFHAAEGVFRTLLTEARGRHLGNHARALSTLTTLYGRAGRYLEAHTLGVHLVLLARSIGRTADRALAFALARVCGALSQLRIEDALGEALAELREVLDRQTTPFDNLELEYHVAASVHATLLGDAVAARAHIEAYRRILMAVRAPDTVYRWALTMADTRVMLLEGRPSAARASLAQLGAGVAAPEFGHLQALVLEVEIGAALGEVEPAVRAGRAALERMAGVDRGSFLAADFVHQGGLLARAFERLGEVELAHQAYDRMAVAVLVSLEQVDECARWLPELGPATGEDMAPLSRARKKFLREQKALLGRVARLLESQGKSRVRALLAHPEKAGLVAICAWCESVRTSEDLWLPIGHFVPRSGPFEVTHGMCPPCAADFDRNADDEAPASLRRRASS